jgi:hypothetical protein
VTLEAPGVADLFRVAARLEAEGLLAASVA